MDYYIEDLAYEFAEKAHRGQVRKYTGEPYITHPAAVAEIVKKVGGDSNMIAAAYLHDVIEDCGITKEEIESLFDADVANLVDELSYKAGMVMGNRAVRKEFERKRITTISDRAKTIKLADLIHNSGSIMRYGKGFAVTYMSEKRDLLPGLKGGDKVLHAKAEKIVHFFYGGT